MDLAWTLASDNREPTRAHAVSLMSLGIETGRMPVLLNSLRISLRLGSSPGRHWVAAVPAATPQRSHSAGGAPSSICQAAAASIASPAPRVLRGVTRGGLA